MKRTIILWSILFLTFLNGCKSEKEIMHNELKAFIVEFEKKIKPLNEEAALTYFDATVTGSKELFDKYEKLQLEIEKAYSNKDDFLKLKRIKESNLIEDPLMLRELDLLYKAFLSRQADEKLREQIIKLSTQTENIYSTFRTKVDGKELTDNEIEDILTNSTNEKELEKVYLASKQVGKAVADSVLKLVKMRNELARQLGFENYHQMSLILSDQDPNEIENIFDELDSLTRDIFAQLKNEIDNYLCSRFKITKDKLRPWHYQNRFFQEAPKIYQVDLDQYYKNQNIAELARKYFNSLDLNVDDILAKSDLYEKEKKYQHAYCITIKRNDDVRILCNIKPDSKWMNTTLHELGHAVYDRYINPSLPYFLREPAHTFVTEAVAMFFGRLASDPVWMKDLAVISDEEAAKISEITFKILKLEQLVFSRWAQVMYRFEKAMYENPDQDLNSLWKNLVEKYQLLKYPENRNEPDWAAKIHIALYPAYYHNYLLGELLASQFNYKIKSDMLKIDPNFPASFYNDKRVGKFFKEKVFSVGASYPWNKMIEKATGEKLTAKYYALQFVK